jgi:type 1 fimbria pilin
LGVFAFSIACASSERCGGRSALPAHPASQFNVRAIRTFTSHRLLRCSAANGDDIVKKLTCLLAGLAIASASSTASACAGNGTILAWYNIAKSLDIINNAASLPEGTVLTEIFLPFLQGSTTLTNCSGMVKLEYAGATGAHNTMNTGIPGIGGRIRYQGGSGLGLPSGYLPVTGSESLRNSENWGWSGFYIFELVKTGAMRPGKYTLPTSWMVVKINNAVILSANISFQKNAVPVPIEVKQSPTCSLSSSTIQASLGTVPVRNFGAVGSTSAAVPFNIRLNCSGGDAGVLSNIYMTITDQRTPANESDTLSLTAASTATGVGVQILNGTTVINYGPDASAPGTKNQWFAGHSGNSSFTIPLTARYVKTATNITPGTANAVATFTMSYQ